MYTVGAALGLLCFWALLRFLDGRRAYWWLGVYALSAAAGLYVLYYFAFLLIALNLIAVGAIGCSAAFQGRRMRLALTWLAGQAGAFVLWLPWLPTFWRQATDPPVPPWRVPWASLNELLASVAEAGGALLVGQSPPLALPLLWAGASTLVLILLLVTARSSRRAGTGSAPRPVAARDADGSRGPSCLHPGADSAPLWHQPRADAGLSRSLSLSLCAALCSSGSRCSRRPVSPAALARRWPGDAASLPCNWPAWFTSGPNPRSAPMTTGPQSQRWPTSGAPAMRSSPTPGGSIPFWTPTGRRSLPALVTHCRRPCPLRYALLTIRKPNCQRERFRCPSWCVRVASTAPRPLGWGSPASDFFAISTAATEEALAALAQRHPRLWHYRLYDTVSDPQGVIRTWLDQHATLVQEQTIPGRDFGALQLFALQPTTATPTEYSTAPGNALPDDASFDGALTLLSHTAPVSVSAGSYLYTDLFWQIDQRHGRSAGKSEPEPAPLRQLRPIGGATGWPSAAARRPAADRNRGAPAARPPRCSQYATGSLLFGTGRLSRRHRRAARLAGRTARARRATVGARGYSSNRSELEGWHDCATIAATAPGNYPQITGRREGTKITFCSYPFVPSCLRASCEYSVLVCELAIEMCAFHPNQYTDPS